MGKQDNNERAALSASLHHFPCCDVLSRNLFWYCIRKEVEEEKVE